MELEDEPAPSEAPELLEALELLEELELPVELLPPPPVIAPKTGCTRTKIDINTAQNLVMDNAPFLSTLYD